ncbi:DUF502 domain-containing protein [Aegicerativicinus sediminis]|uniref:hypothetical protein n=1 Tax=Aegicerativicinus sediminis TaxID=2893202 RepID=UPI001E39B730|nr:hypothetical protein [Aegicerativicinus sediminis]
MKPKQNSFRPLVIGGLFFLIPILLFIFLIRHTLAILKPMVSKFLVFLDIQTVIGAYTVTILTVFVLILIAYISGVLIKKGIIHNWNNDIENQLFMLFPSLQMMKYKYLKEEDQLGNNNYWKAILLKEDTYYVIAFITHKDETGNISVLIPDAPRMGGGEIRYYKDSECIYIPISMQAAMRALNSFGNKGDLAAELTA